MWQIRSSSGLCARGVLEFKSNKPVTFNKFNFRSVSLLSNAVHRKRSGQYKCSPGQQNKFLVFPTNCTKFSSTLCDSRWPHLTTAELRNKFLEYFQTSGHEVVKSSSVIPKGDSTLLFTNSGMVQFKDYFAGFKKPPYLAATTCQKCVRIDGKHNDLDNIGYTIRHHSFFEMLGNFSFGAYGPEEAIVLAWNFLTKILKLPKNRFFVTVLRGDTETSKIWHEVIGLTRDRIEERDENENFWMMDSTGPCGPCTEIYWDCANSDDKDVRFIEIWNLVFMKYFRNADGTTTALNQTYVDTGMGLERLSLLIQKKKDVFEIDSISGLLESTRNVVRQETGTYEPNSKNECFIRVIADHLRSSSFLIANGLIPGNQGRAYVLRRLVKRSTRSAQQLGLNRPIFARLIPSLLDSFQNCYPELNQWQEHIQNTLNSEEELFYSKFNDGLNLLHRTIDRLESTSNSTGTIGFDVSKEASNNYDSNQIILNYSSDNLLLQKKIPGVTMFNLYESFGFPVDLTESVANERGWTVDVEGFERILAESRSKNRSSAKDMLKRGEMPEEVLSWIDNGQQFSGYDEMYTENARVLNVYCEQSKFRTWICIHPCPFFADAGGQVGDVGVIELGSGVLRVLKSISILGTETTALVLEGGCEEVLAGLLKPGIIVGAKVDVQARTDTQKNHTATHLLHAALSATFGREAVQCGSYVSASRLRFDFNHRKALSRSQLSAIETWISNVIQLQLEVQVSSMTFEEALSKKAIAPFEEKYDVSQPVRVINIPGVSCELCCGTHVKNTLEINVFKITSQSSVSSGIRRIEAVTGNHAILWLSRRSDMLEKLSGMLGYGSDIVEEKIIKKLENMTNLNKSSQKQIEALQLRLLECLEKTALDVNPLENVLTADSHCLLKGFYDLHPIHVHSYYLHSPLEPKCLRNASDRILQESDSNAIVMLLSAPYALICTRNQNLPPYLLGDIAQKVGIVGGGSKFLVEGKLQLDQLTTLKKIHSLENFNTCLHC